MNYKTVIKGKFISRPNRFIAYVEIDGKVEVCHVKNTGRCKEILIPGAKVYVEKSDNPIFNSEINAREVAENSHKTLNKEE